MLSARIHSAAVSISGVHFSLRIKAFLQTGTGKAAAVALLVFLAIAILPFHNVDLWLENFFTLLAVTSVGKEFLSSRGSTTQAKFSPFSSCSGVFF